MNILKLSSLAALTGLLAYPAEPLVPATNPPACCAKPQLGSGTLSRPPSERSLYQLDSVWTNDAGRPRKLATLAGRPQIVTLFFASCVSACPILVHDMQRIEAALPEELRAKVGFTLITFDSARDTPEVLATFRKIHDLGANWTLLRAEPDDVLELAALLGVKFKKDTLGQFAHSNVITVLNPEGEVVYQELGLNRGPAAIITAAQATLQ